jgi:anti-anti-sigma factor
MALDRAGAMNADAGARNGVSVSGDGPTGRNRIGAFEIGAMDMPGARVVWCRGELDISSEEQVVTEVARALGRPLTSIILDLRGLTFADWTAIRCIEYAAAACNRCQVTLYVDAGETVKKLASTLDRDQLGGAEGYL